MKLKSTLKKKNDEVNDLSSSDSSNREDEDDDSSSISNSDEHDDDDDDGTGQERAPGQSPALQATLAKRESKAVLGMRFLVFGVLIVSLWQPW